jgi:iron complex transport system substrate-binding protein
MKEVTILNRGKFGITLSFFFGLLLLWVFIFTGCLAQGNKESQDNNDQTPTSIIITDMAGRDVSVKIPVNRIVLASSRHLHEFTAVGGTEAIDKVVGWGSDLKLYDQDTYLTYEESFPGIAEIVDIGYHYKSTFSVETVVNLQPDVIVFPLWLVDTEGVSDDISKLDTAGIPSVFIDYYVDPFNNPVPSIRIIGQLLGAETRAREIIYFYEEQVNLITNRLDTYDGTKTTAYVEVGSKGPSEYGNTYSSESGLGALVKFAGGISIADGFITGSGPINPEYLLTADPDIIIISGSYWPSVETAMRLGYHADETDPAALLQAFAERDGWENLSAVQDGRVYSIFHGFSFRIYNFAGIQAFAKWLYPGLFVDINPAANFKEFHDRFLPVEFSGVWILDLAE